VKIKSFALGFCFLATTASAQTPLQTYALAALADNASTIQFLSHGTGEEGNPLINWIEDEPTMLAFGLAADVAATYSWFKLTKHHQKLQAIGLYSAALVRLGLAVNNVSINKHRQGGTNVPIPYTRDRRRIAFSMSVPF